MTIVNLSVSRAEINEGITKINSITGTASEINEVLSNVKDKQDKLVSGTNIKTVNNQSLVGSGNIVIEGSGVTDYSATIFDVKWADHLLSSLSWLRADTFSWQDGTVYVTALNHLANDIDGVSPSTETIGDVTITFYRAVDGHKICLADQEANVQEIYTNIGVAWYYIYDQENSRFKLPRTKYGLEGLRDNVEDLQTRMSTQYSSMLVRTSDSSPEEDITGYSTQMYLYFYVGEYTREAVEQTAGLNAELFNGKLDTNLSNLSNTAKSELAKMSLPSVRYDGLKLGANNSTYEAPASGYFQLSKYAAWAGQEVALYNLKNTSDIILANNTFSSDANQLLHVSIPASKGDIVKVHYTAGGRTVIFRFIWAEGDRQTLS